MSIPGTIQANIQIASDLHEAMREVQTKRSRQVGSCVRLCSIYREAVQFFLKHTDPDTGALIPPPAPPAPRKFIQCDTRSSKSSIADWIKFEVGQAFR